MGGATISFKIILDYMLTLGCNVVVLVSKDDLNEDFIEYMTTKGCMVENFDAEMAVYPSVKFLGWQDSFVKFPKRLILKIYRLIRSNRQTLKLIRKYNPDIVHTNVGVYQQGVRACKKLKIPHLWHLREYQTKDFGFKIFPSKGLFNHLLRTTNVVSITNDILEYFDLKHTKSATALYDGILPASSATYVHDKKPYFLCANRISPEKKIEVIIEAFAIFAEKSPNYRLMIVGKAENKSYLVKLNEIVARLSLSDQIVFHDFCPNVIKLMKDATALVVASQFEGLGRMTVEASFMGCLVLGRNTGGTKEILNFTGGGYLFNTTEELTQQMFEVVNLAGSEEYKKKVLSAQQIAINHFSNVEYCRLIYALYKECITNLPK